LPRLKEFNVLQSFVGELDQLRTIFDSISNGVTVCDARLPDHPLVYVNLAFETMTGYAAQQACGQNCRFLQANDTDQAAIAELRLAIAERRTTRVVLRNYRKDGTAFWNELTISFLLNDAGEVSHIVGIQTDVTSPMEAALRTERQLARQTTQAQLILETVEDGIYGLDLAGVTTFANRAAEAMTGFTAAELLGNRQHEMIHHSYADGEHRPAQDCPIYLALRDGTVSRNDDDIFWCKDGSSFPVGYISKPIVVNGQPEGAVVIFRDISQRKRHEAWAKAKDAVMLSVTSHQPIEETLAKIARAYAELFPTCSVAIFTIAPGELRLRAEMGIPAVQRQQLLHADLLDPTFLCVRAAVSRQDVRSSRHVEHDQDLRWLAEPSINFCIARPLLSSSSHDVLGVIEFFAAKEDAFGKQANEWVDTLCDLTRLAMEHHQLYAQLTFEHDRAEQALLQSEGRFRTLADCCPTLMWMTDALGEITFINKKFRELFLTTREEVSGGKWRILIHPDDEVRVSKAFTNAVAEPSDYACVLRLLDRAGDWRTMESRAAPLLSAAGRYLGHVGFNLDITERLQAELLLKESADRLALALQAGSIGIFDFNALTGQFIWDDQMLRILGVSRESFGTDHAAWQSIVHPGDERRVMEGLESALRGERQFDTDVRVVWPDGTLRHIHTLAVVQRDADGSPVRMIGANWDVTLQKQGEDELQLSNCRLRDAMLRSNELASEAAAANTAKSSFLATMSHEIRTPMNGVMGMIQLLLTTELSAEQRGFADLAKSSSGLLLALIDDVLDLSKIEAGKLVIEHAEFDLHRTVAETANIWRSQGLLKGIGLRSEIDPGISRLVSGDSHRVRQILNNLVSNAVKYTDAGGVTIYVEPISAEDGEALIRFRVSDSGIGISPQQQIALFQPFVQADVTTTRRFGGSGLGLAICKQLVEAMGGKIGLDSEPGKGSTFWFVLPLGLQSVAMLDGKPASDAAAKPVSLSSFATAPQGWTPGPSPATAGMLILVAEDNATNRIVALAQLEKLGYGSNAVFNGCEAVRAASERQYNLILMDCEMPMIDGYEATRAIRASGNSVPIIAVTAHAMPGDRARCLAAGMNDFISKPVDFRELDSMLRRWCHPGILEPQAPSDQPEQTEKAIVDFDPQSLMARLMDDKEMANLILRSFAADFPVQLALLTESCEAKNLENVLRLVHALKGAAAAASACAVREVLLQLEALGVSRQWKEFASLLSSLAAVFLGFQEAIKSFRNEGELARDRSNQRNYCGAGGGAG
jgi:PAS domain S-box-containing protein